MGLAALLVPLIPTAIELLAGVGTRFTGDKGDRIIGLVSGFLKSGAQEYAVIQEIKAMVDSGQDPDDNALFGVIDRIDANTDRLNAAVDKVIDAAQGSGEGGG